MSKLNEIIYKFINEMNYSEDEIIGIVVCGSFITGYATEKSDIDINVIKTDTSKELVRGVKTIDGYKFEYFEKPISDYYRELSIAPKKQKGALLPIIGYGKIIIDKDNKIQELKNQVLNVYNKPTPVLEINEAKELLAIIDNRIIRLNDSYKNNSIDFESIYYLLLERIRKFYSRKIGCYSIPPEKAIKVYSDLEYAKKYCGGPIPDQEFIDLYYKALKAMTRTEKIAIINEIYEYTKKGIEFDPNNYRIYIKSRY